MIVQKILQTKFLNEPAYRWALAAIAATLAVKAWSTVLDKIDA